MRKYFNSRDYCGGILIEIKLQKNIWRMEIQEVWKLFTLCVLNFHFYIDFCLLLFEFFGEIVDPFIIIKIDCERDRKFSYLDTYQSLSLRGSKNWKFLKEHCSIINPNKFETRNALNKSTDFNLDCLFFGSLIDFQTKRMCVITLTLTLHLKSTFPKKYNAKQSWNSFEYKLK